jgi:hypothetical protein
MKIQRKNAAPMGLYQKLVLIVLPKCRSYGAGKENKKQFERRMVIVKLIINHSTNKVF